MPAKSSDPVAQLVEQRTFNPIPGTTDSCVHARPRTVTQRFRAQERLASQQLATPPAKLVPQVVPQAWVRIAIAAFILGLLFGCDSPTAFKPCTAQSPGVVTDTLMLLPDGRAAVSYWCAR